MLFSNSGFPTGKWFVIVVPTLISMWYTGSFVVVLTIGAIAVAFGLFLWLFTSAVNETIDWFYDHKSSQTNRADKQE